ncbi:MAG: nucleotidyltransferase family protein [Deltaproteobacteria bacterium]|nr:nucleotidyltransferase family protein [Deltaproteobacteria bacterium]
METQPDLRELLVLFNEEKVEYLIVGGYALAFHGAPRYTGDLDLLVRPEPANAQRILKALMRFGFGSLNLTLADFTDSDRVIQLGQPPVRIDLVTSITGVSWEEAFSSRVPGAYGNVPVYFLGRDTFIRNKRAIGRAKDIADIEALDDR